MFSSNIICSCRIYRLTLKLFVCLQRVSRKNFEIGHGFCVTSNVSVCARASFVYARTCACGLSAYMRQEVIENNSPNMSVRGNNIIEKVHQILVMNQNVTR